MILIKLCHLRFTTVFFFFRYSRWEVTRWWQP